MTAQQINAGFNGWRLAFNRIPQNAQIIGGGALYAREFVQKGIIDKMAYYLNSVYPFPPEPPHPRWSPLKVHAQKTNKTEHEVLLEQLGVFRGIILNMGEPARLAFGINVLSAEVAGVNHMADYFAQQFEVQFPNRTCDDVLNTLSAIPLDQAVGGINCKRIFALEQFNDRLVMFMSAVAVVHVMPRRYLLADNIHVNIRNDLWLSAAQTLEQDLRFNIQRMQTDFMNQHGMNENAVNCFQRLVLGSELLIAQCLANLWM